jgi:hypothetical protein
LWKWRCLVPHLTAIVCIALRENIVVMGREHKATLDEIEAYLQKAALTRPGRRDRPCAPGR